MQKIDVEESRNDAGGAETGAGSAEETKQVNKVWRDSRDGDRRLSPLQSEARPSVQ